MLPGPIGTDAIDDLEVEYRRLLERRGPILAGAWYTSHLVRPSTWALRRALRRARGRSGRRAGVGLRESSTSRGGRGAGGPGFDISWLDVKLGLRMLLKHRGLTLVSGLAMSVTIAIAIGTFSLFQDFLLRPTVPLAEGDRIVSLGMLAGDRQLTHRQLLHDYTLWRGELETVEQLSIWRHHRENIVNADGVGERASFVMMSASGFEVARVPPLLGRPLLASDEVPGAPPVVVIGYRDWTERYRGDPDVIGRTMQIGRQAHTIVGVMPEAYGFPFAALRWLPFRDDPDDFTVMETPYSYFVFGRLAPGTTMEVAQAELSAIASRRANELPDSHAHLRSIVMSYTDTHTGMDNAGGLFVVRVLLGMLTMLVLVPFVNVATLVYARTATRGGELSIRSALGASRRRVVSQLFVEALVLASLSAVVGVGLVAYGFGVVDAITAGIGDGGGMPFWVRRGRDPWVAAYVVGLTLLAAVVAGVVPGLKATGRGVQARLNRAASGNGMRLGRAWTALIVVQVATTVGFLPFAASMGWQILGMGLTRPTFQAESMLAGRLSGPPSAFAAEAVAFPDPTGERAEARARARVAVEEVIRRVEADERVADVTLSSEVPGTLFGSSRYFEVEGVPSTDEAPGHRAGEMGVAHDFFETIGVDAAVGRLLHATDVDAESPPVVVNRAFVDEVLGGANALGRRVRYATAPDAEPAPWREIVGVVEDLVLNPTHPDRVEPQLYAPLDRADAAEGVFLVVRVPGETAAFVPELRRITTAVDPTLVLGTVTPLGDLGGVLSSMIGAGALAFGIVFAAGLLLCAAGVFALMSFSVTQRRREIGVRSALGAHPRRVLVNVLGRSLRQVVLGVALGVFVVWAIPPINADGIIIDASAGPIALVALLMVGVGVLAAVGPARRGLRIHPTEALREV